MRAVLFVIVSSLFVYAAAFQFAGSIELWGDEIGVIRIAQLPLFDIVNAISHLHAAALPFDYWIMWFWNVVVLSLPTEYQEVIYRIPYMVFHIAASLLFAYTIITRLLIPQKKTHSSRRVFRMCLFLCSFFLYFLNPLLFFYSIEVRFYAFASLGSMVALYLYSSNNLLNPRTFFIHLPFLLNSIFHYIVVVPLMLFEEIRTKQHKYFLAFAILVILLFMFIKSSIFIPEPVSSSNFLLLLTKAIFDFVYIQFGQLPQIIVGGYIVFLLFIKSSEARRMVFIVLIFIASICGISFYKGYFDFHVRHFLFVVPFVLYALLLPIKRIFDYKLKYIFLIVVSIVFPLFWSGQIFHRLATARLFSKALKGSKNITTKAMSERSVVLLMPNDPQRMAYWDYRFYVDSILFYFQAYPEVVYLAPTSSKQLCVLFGNIQNSFIVGPPQITIDCGLGKLEKNIIFGSVIIDHANEN